MELQGRLTKAQEAQLKVEQDRLTSLSDEDLREEIFNNAPTPPHEPTLAEQEMNRRMRERKAHG